MNILPRIQLDPTFPLDAEELRRETWRRKLRHPLTWVPVIAGGAALAASGSLFVLLGGLAAIGVGVGMLWYNPALADRVEESVVEEMVARSNDEQDQILMAAARRYRWLGQAGYAKALTQFVALKQRIERQLAKGTVEAVERAALEGQVDRVCGAVCDQFNQVIGLQQALGESILSSSDERLDGLIASMRQILEPVRRSYAHLYSTHRYLSDLERGYPAERPRPDGDEEEEGSLVPGRTLEEDLRAEAEALEGLPELLEEMARDEEWLEQAQDSIDREIELLDDEFSSVLLEGTDLGEAGNEQEEPGRS